MAHSTCPKCGGGFFHLKKAPPLGADYEILFVQCSQCGTPVGVTDMMNVPAVLAAQNRALRAIAEAVGVEVEL